MFFFYYIGNKKVACTVEYTSRFLTVLSLSDNTKVGKGIETTKFICRNLFIILFGRVGEVLTDGKVSFEVYGETRKDGKAISHDGVPRFNPYFMLDDLLAEDSLPEQTLQEFMGDRFGYNIRVFNNMKVIQKEIRKKQK
jgi:hypothetical protein